MFNQVSNNLPPILCHKLTQEMRYVWSLTDIGDKVRAASEDLYTERGNIGLPGDSVVSASPC